LVVQYAMSMNRLAQLLSTEAKRFSAGALARMLRYVAHRFAPIYLSLFDSLAGSAGRRRRSSRRSAAWSMGFQ
jgi:hypothetical protein